jgi:hypothetical protein
LMGMTSPDISRLSVCMSYEAVGVCLS